MKRSWKIIGSLVLAGLLTLVLVGVVALAQEGEGTAWPFDFRQRLHEAIAGALGISAEEYDSAVDTAREQVLGDAVAEGWLTEDQAARMKERAAEGFGRGMGGPAFGRRAPGAFMGRGEGSLLAVAADELGMAVDELVTELQAGQSIAEVAAAQGVELQAIADAFVAQRAEALGAAVEEGRITQNQADWMLEHMSEEVLEHLQGGVPLGRRGLGGCGRHGGFGPAPSLPGESES